MLHLEALPPGTLDLLKELSWHPSLEPFGLVGGTSLALRFGHRMSEDLDFFTTDSFDSESLAIDVSHGRDSEIRRSGPNMLHIFLNGIKVDFATHRYPRLEPLEMVDEDPASLTGATWPQVKKRITAAVKKMS